MQIKICLYGPTGSGKTTVAQHLVLKFGAKLIKIAEPLYTMQNSFYEMLGTQVSGQDGELLQFMAYKIEKEFPHWLARQFLQKVHSSDGSLVVNDDCRFNSYLELKADDFVFVRVYSAPMVVEERLRKDHTSIDPNHLVEQGFEKFEPDYTIDNNGPLEKTFSQIDSIMETLIHSSNGWLTGNKIWDEVRAYRIHIQPFDPDCLNPNSYNYHLASSLKRLTSKIIDCKKPDEFETIQLPEEGYVLEPNECYLGTTQEVFGSNFYASLVTGRSSVGRKFVTNHITAGLIDQGFFGNITLEIVAQKPTRVYPGMKFGQIFWFTTFGRPLLYKGKYQSQVAPTGSELHKDFTDIDQFMPVLDESGR
jgi:dCTP deaminase